MVKPVVHTARVDDLLRRVEHNGRRYRECLANVSRYPRGVRLSAELAEMNRASEELRAAVRELAVLRPQA